MTISTELRKAGPFTGNGVTTAFPFSFKVFAATDVAVTVANTQGNESALALGADYAVALNADQDAAPGGTVTLAAPLASGHRLVVSSVVPNLQPTDITNNGGFYPRVIEDALDRHVAQIQQIDEKVDRALKAAITSQLGDQALPAPVAGMLIGWNESNDGLKNYAPIGGTLLGQQLAAAGGSALVGFQQSGSGAAVRTAQDKMREFVSVKDFGAVGDGVTDDTAAIQAACTAAKTIIFGSSADNYRVTGTITLTSGITLLMQGATVTQATDQTPIFNATGTDNVTITGGRFFGKSEASYTNSPSSQAICIKANNATDLVVVGNRFENFWYSPLMVDVGGNRIEFSSNNVKGPGSAVLGVDANRRNTTGCTLTGANLRIVNNDIYDTAQGIIVGQGSENVTIDGNVIHDLINEHGIYADTGIRRLTISNNVIRSTGASGVGLKVQCYDEFGVQTQNVAITGNVIDNTGSAGILVINTSTAPTLMAVGVTISGNTVLNAGANAIDVRSAEDCLVVGNTAVASSLSGIYWDRCGNLTIADNYIRGSVTSGMRDGGSSSNGVVIKDNTIRNCATGNSVGDEFGIFLNSGATNCVIDGNVISDANANMQYGVYVIPNINSALSIVNNTVMQATDGALRLNSTAALREYRGNSLNGTTSATYNDPVLPVVASAATLTLPTAHDVVEISGTTTITAIAASGHSGRRVTLLFQGALTVVRSAQIVLNQNFVTTGNDTLTLISNGGVWLEVARSAN